MKYLAHAFHFAAMSLFMGVAQTEPDVSAEAARQKAVAWMESRSNASIVLKMRGQDGTSPLPTRVFQLTDEQAGRGNATRHFQACMDGNTVVLIGFGLPPVRGMEIDEFRANVRSVWVLMAGLPEAKSAGWHVHVEFDNQREMTYKTNLISLDKDGILRFRTEFAARGVLGERDAAQGKSRVPLFRPRISAPQLVWPGHEREVLADEDRFYLGSESVVQLDVACRIELSAPAGGEARADRSLR